MRSGWEIVFYATDSLHQRGEALLKSGKSHGWMDTVHHLRYSGSSEQMSAASHHASFKKKKTVYDTAPTQYRRVFLKYWLILKGRMWGVHLPSGSVHPTGEGWLHCLSPSLVKKKKAFFIFSADWNTTAHLHRSSPVRRTRLCSSPTAPSLTRLCFTIGYNWASTARPSSSASSSSNHQDALAAIRIPQKHTHTNAFARTQQIQIAFIKVYSYFRRPPPLIR